MALLRTTSLLVLTTVLACGDDSSADGGSTSTADSGSATDTNPSTGMTPEPTTTDAPSNTTGGGSESGPDPDTGTDADTGTEDGDSGSSGDPPMGEPVTIAVGYGGIRVRSLDDGQTWQDHQQLAPSGGDDNDLLRGAAWGAGRFVAVGWRLFSSEDGVTWTEHDNPTGQWYGAVAYGNDQFLASGGGGYCARSSDGQTWEECTDVTDGGGFVHVRSVLFLDGLFYAADADGVLRSSPDGTRWSVEDDAFGTPWAAVVDGMIVPMEQTAPADFATKRLRGSGNTIERAEPGTEAWETVFTIPDDNNVFQAFRFAFAEGWVQ